MPDLQDGIRRSKRINKIQGNNVCLAQTPQLGAGRGMTPKPPLDNL